ncbi:MAG: DUF3025 domain-containing protein [Betaproteobacteria bacterium]
MAFGLELIDWPRPWFAGWRELGSLTSEFVAEHGNVCSALNAVHRSLLANDLSDSTGLLEDISSAQSAKSEGDTVRAHTRFAHQIARASATLTLGSGGSVEFVPQSDLPAEIAYEAFIFSHKRIPTRDNLHDFFNGLCWLRFPQAKSRLNFLQAQAIASEGVGATRGPLRDALTLFDENVLLLQASDDLWRALQVRDWEKLFGELRDEWQSAHIVIFGHALLEKLVTPYKSITAHVFRIASDVDTKDDQALDAWLANNLQPDYLATKPYLPLPVLGIPGWWPENEDLSFYSDTQVFRLA